MLADRQFALAGARGRLARDCGEERGVLLSSDPVPLEPTGPPLTDALVVAAAPTAAAGRWPELVIAEAVIISPDGEHVITVGMRSWFRRTHSDRGTRPGTRAGGMSRRRDIPLAILVVSSVS
jgi:hypothetical protein